MSRDAILNILDLARWAPSGDNTQPWRFEIVSDEAVRVHGFDTRDSVLYDFQGHASHIAHGALLETMSIAATGHGMATTYSIDSDGEDRTPTYSVRFERTERITRDPLLPFVQSRTVQRRPMQTTRLTSHQREAIINAAGNEFDVQIFESATEKLRIAKILWDSAKIRLTCPEAYLVHKEIIEWRARYSASKIPELAVGVDKITARLMEWALKSWSRVNFMNRFLFGTVIPRIELDLLPGLCCAAHILVKPAKEPDTLISWISLGRAVQRIWLTATSLGLQLQPQMTPLIFQWYVRAGLTFTSTEQLHDSAQRLSDAMGTALCSKPSEFNGFFARVGLSNPPNSRSIRHELDDLLK